MTERWRSDGEALIAEAQDIARLCRDAGRWDLAAWPEALVSRVRRRMADMERLTATPTLRRRVARFLRAVRL